MALVGNALRHRGPVLPRTLNRSLRNLLLLPQHCDRGSLRDALSEKRLALPDGRPNLASVGKRGAGGTSGWLLRRATFGVLLSFHH